MPQPKQAKLPLEVEPKTKAKTKAKTKEPATEVMKIVAAKTTNTQGLANIFSPVEIDEIVARRSAGAELDKNEKVALRMQYRKIKRLVKEMENGNNQKIIVFPCLTNKNEWFKVIEFSALYYVYRLAPRMGRSAKIYNDADKHAKAVFSATFQNIETFVEQIKQLEDPEIETTLDGVYIFTLKRPLPDDEVLKLRHIDQARREQMYNVTKPAKMNPAVFQQILLISRMLVPRARKLKKEFYNTTGEMMVKDIQSLLAAYFDYSNALIEKEEMKTLTIQTVNRLLAGVTILSENKIWEYDNAVVIGTGIIDLKKLIEKDLGVKGNG